MWKCTAVSTVQSPREEMLQPKLYVISCNGSKYGVLAYGHTMTSHVESKFAMHSQTFANAVVLHFPYQSRTPPETR